MARMITGSRKIDKGASYKSFLKRLTAPAERFQWAQIRFWVSPQNIPTNIASRSKVDNQSWPDLRGNSFKVLKSRIIGGSLEIG